eukprot:655844-Pelagomonas_calceolata.AAC.2
MAVAAQLPVTRNNTQAGPYLGHDKLSLLKLALGVPQPPDSGNESCGAQPCPHPNGVSLLLMDQHVAG